MRPTQNESYLLSTGTILCANKGIIGLSEERGKFEIYGGYDEEYFMEGDGLIPPDITNEEAKEICDFMIDMWGRYKKQLDEQKRPAQD